MDLSQASIGQLFESLFFTFFICIIAAIYATKLAVKTELLDRPNAEPHKKHDRVVPLSGGIALMFTILIATLIFRNKLGKDLHGVILASAVIFAFALLDDYRNLNWKIKLAGQILGAILMILFGTRTHLFDAVLFRHFMPASLSVCCDYGLTILWMVFITNAFNLVDSADGLMLGLTSWALGFFMIAAIDAGQIPLSLFCTIILGPCIALLFFNSHPAILFMGDSGAQMLGFLLAAIAIIYNPAQRLQANTWFMPILLLGVPIFDTTMVIISRHRRGKHFYSSGNDHTFHRLLKMGFSMQQASVFMHSIAFALEVIAFFAISRSRIISNVIFGVVVLLGIGAIVFLEKENLWEPIINFNQKSKDIS